MAVYNIVYMSVMPNTIWVGSHHRLRTLVMPARLSTCKDHAVSTHTARNPLLWSQLPEIPAGSYRSS